MYDITLFKCLIHFNSFHQIQVIRNDEQFFFFLFFLTSNFYSILVSWIFSFGISINLQKFLFFKKPEFTKYLLAIYLHTIFRSASQCNVYQQISVIKKVSKVFHFTFKLTLTMKMIIPMFHSIEDIVKLKYFVIRLANHLQFTIKIAIRFPNFDENILFIR